MNDKEKRILERLEDYINNRFKGYCIDLVEVELEYSGERMRTHIVLNIKLHDVTNFQLPALELNEGNFTRLAECLEVNRNKILKLQD